MEIRMPYYFVAGDALDFGRPYETDFEQFPELPYPQVAFFDREMGTSGFTQTRLQVGGRERHNNGSDFGHATGNDTGSGQLRHGVHFPLEAPATSGVSFGSRIELAQNVDNYAEDQNFLAFCDANGDPLYLVGVHYNDNVSVYHTEGGGQTLIPGAAATVADIPTLENTFNLADLFAIRLIPGAGGSVKMWLGSDVILDIAVDFPDLGPIHSMRLGGFGGGSCKYSELVVCSPDIDPSTLRVKPLRPLEDGSLGEWYTKTYGTSNLHTQVDDTVPWNSYSGFSLPVNSFIQAFGDGARQTFETDPDDLPGGSWEPQLVQITTMARRNATPPSGFDMKGHVHILQTDAGAAEGAIEHTIGENWAMRSTMFQNNPITGDPWKPGDLAGLQIGMKSVLVAPEEE